MSGMMVLTGDSCSAGQVDERSASIQAMQSSREYEKEGVCSVETGGKIYPSISSRVHKGQHESIG